jgi:hypothetical protein
MTLFNWICVCGLFAFFQYISYSYFVSLVASVYRNASNIIDEIREGSIQTINLEKKMCELRLTQNSIELSTTALNNCKNVIDTQTATIASQMIVIQRLNHDLSLLKDSKSVKQVSEKTEEVKPETKKVLN